MNRSNDPGDHGVDPGDVYGQAIARLGYDFAAALHYNRLGEHLAHVSAILLELTGEHDGANWHWIVELADGRRAYVTGGCDYTGWDCQSGADWHDADDMPAALALCGDDVRREFEDMIEKGEKARPSKEGW